MTFAELLHQIVDDAIFGGRIDKEEAHKAIDTQFPTPLVPSETVTEPEAPTPPLEITETV